MDWLFDNIRFVVIAGAAIAYWLNQRRNKALEEEAEKQRPSRQAQQKPGADSLEQAERTRRIQEEIRRKIAERAAGSAQPVPPQQPPPLMREPIPVFEEEGHGYAEDEKAAQRAQAEALQRRAEELALLERQRQLSERLRELEEKRRQPADRAAAFAAMTAAVNEHPAAPGSLLEALRTPQSARRAIVLREVLSPPLSLR